MANGYSQELARDTEEIEHSIVSSWMACLIGRTGGLEDWTANLNALYPNAV